jgi:hypothetical protein
MVHGPSVSISLTADQPPSSWIEPPCTANTFPDSGQSSVAR